MNGVERTKPNGTVWVIGTISGSAILALATLMFNLFNSVARDAQISLDVAAQHGDEINQIRGEISALRNEVLGRTGNRYTAIDAQRDAAHYERELARINRRLSEMESE